jgi:hypothetical protein
MNERVEDDDIGLLSEGGPPDQESVIEQLMISNNNNEEEQAYSFLAASPSTTTTTTTRSHRLHWRLVKLSTQLVAGSIILPWLVIGMCPWVSNNCGLRHALGSNRSVRSGGDTSAVPLPLHGDFDIIWVDALFCQGKIFWDSSFGSLFVRRLYLRVSYRDVFGSYFPLLRTLLMRE